MRAFALAALVLLAGCAAGPPGITPAQLSARTADVPPPAVHPPGVISSFPPSDPSFSQLKCYNNGEDSICTRGD